MRAARVLRAGLGLGVALACCLAANASAQQALADICTPGEVKLFACVLKTGPQIGFCLGKADLKMRFVVRAGDTQASSPVRDLHEATIGGNAQGDVITLQGDTKDGPVALYVDFIADDVLPPVLVQGAGAKQIKEPCASMAFETDHAEVGTGSTKHEAGLSSLHDIGVARVLTPAPNWPD